MNTLRKGWFSVTIDTEEEGLWSGTYSSESTVDNIGSIPLFQDVCDRFQVRPSYLLTTPVAESKLAARILRPIALENRCEIGTHVHPWNSPPITADADKQSQSFLCNLEPEVQHAKLEEITELIERKFGQRPISFRAGRYGIGTQAIQSLRQLGYRVDSSVLPGKNYAGQSGPDFSTKSCRPYYPADEDFLKPGNETSLLEIPVTSGYTHQFFSLARNLRQFAMRSPFRQLRAVGILDRTGIATKVKLSPEQATLSQMKKLSSAVIRQGIPILVLMFHSSSLLPGCSPYVKNQNDLKDFLSKLAGLFEFLQNDLQLSSITLGECYDIRHQLTQDNSN